VPGIASSVPVGHLGREQARRALDHAVGGVFAN
jgi:FtsZ-interacting cell division protein YlmF